MKELLSSGRLVDIALVVMLLELLVVTLARKKSGSHLGVVDVVGQLSAGALLLLALRNTLTGGDFRITLLWLTASFPAHVFDLVRRARAV